MTRVKQREDKDRLILKELIDKMFEIAGHDLKFEDVEGRKDNWFQQYTMTEAQNKEWREWGTKHIKKKKRYYSKIASREMAFLDLYCGLKISDSKYDREESNEA
jgi:hypothetical protein